MTKSEISTYTIDDYASPAALAGVHVSRFEENIQRVPNRVGQHRHGYFEVFWLEGEGTHVNDFQDYAIDGPSLIFVTPGQVHAWTRHEDLRGWIVAFTQEFFDGRCQPPSEVLQFPFWYPEDASPLLPVPASGTREFKYLFHEIEAEFTHKAEGYKNALRWLLRTLFVKAARIYSPRAAARAKDGSSLPVREFRLTLESHFKVMQKVGDYAKQLGLSADRLSALTKEYTGFSAGELIRQRLLLESQRLLAHTNLTMAEIAYHLNFQDPSYFSRFFRKQTGQSPGDFRDSVRRRYVS